MRTVCIDVASAPLANAAEFIEAKPRKGTNDPEKQAAQVAAKTQALTEGAGLDIDLARITAIGAWTDDMKPVCYLCQDEEQEKEALTRTAKTVELGWKIITYNGFAFDIPLLMRRARYLGVPFPKISTDRFKSPHVDLMLELSDRDVRRTRSLAFYCKRLGFSDLCKKLSGEEESRIFEHERWDDLRASVAHDVEAVRRIAVWLGVIPEVQQPSLVAASDARRGTP